MLVSQPVAAQDNVRSQEQVSSAIASEGFVPAALLSPIMRNCDEVVNQANTTDARKAALEYCGSVLSSALTTAMNFTIASPRGAASQAKATQRTEITLEETRNKLAAALAAQVAAETALEDQLAETGMLNRQINALRRQISSLQGLLDEADKNRECSCD